MITTSNSFNRIENEIWKTIPQYPNYMASNFGRIKSLKRKFLKNDIIKSQKIDKDGYYRISLKVDGKTKKTTVHLLMAMAFFNHTPNGTNGLVVNHIDHNKLNNNIENLELVTNRYNMAHGYSFKKTQSKYTGVYTANGIWYSTICIKDKSISLCSGYSEEDTAKIYQLAAENVDKYNGDNAEFRAILNTKHNFKKLPQKPIIANRIKRKNTSSKYIGVSYKKNKKTYTAEIKINNIGVFLKQSKSEEVCSKYYHIALNIINEFNGDKGQFRQRINEIYKNI